MFDRSWGSRTMSPTVCSTRTEELLTDAARDLMLAELATRPADRYAAAHLAALRAAAAVLAARSGAPETWQPVCGARGRRRPASAWDQLRAAAPELTEWADYFAAGAHKRSAAAAGLSGAVSAEEAELHYRDAGAFLGLVRALVNRPHAAA
jgi:hypothetical protein